MELQKISELCRGRWVEILSFMGVQASYLSGKHGPCPFCGGKDRFRFIDSNGDGFYFCNQCSSGDGYMFLMKLKGTSLGGALKLVKEFLGIKDELSPEVLAKIAEKKRRMDEVLELWRKAQVITEDCPAGLYLTKRTGITEYPCSLRYIPEMVYREDGEEQSYHPGLLAAVSSPGSGQIVNIYRTFLTKDGDKANVKNVRKSMPGAMPAGSAIRLGKIVDGKVLVAEGLETALSAGLLHRCTAWAMANADKMRSWVPPQGIKHVIIAGDNDESFTGQFSAYCLANRLVCQFKVAKVEVCIPMEVGKDWNDIYSLQQWR